ncbi:hypothetical protein ACDN41_12365 [Priestia aryabhattai]|uniref:hypothetical protein n=1 Tax=Priestia aryabhattai TaxID=412384 RepID=UPI0035322750
MISFGINYLLNAIFFFIMLYGMFIHPIVKVAIAKDKKERRKWISFIIFLWLFVIAPIVITIKLMVIYHGTGAIIGMVLTGAMVLVGYKITNREED